jgi:hypothetical protein
MKAAEVLLFLDFLSTACHRSVSCNFRNNTCCYVLGACWHSGIDQDRLREYLILLERSLNVEVIDHSITFLSCELDE